MFNWFSRACIVWAVHAGSLFVNTTISMAALPEVLALMFFPTPDPVAGIVGLLPGRQEARVSSPRRRGSGKRHDLSKVVEARDCVGDCRVARPPGPELEPVRHRLRPRAWARSPRPQSRPLSPTFGARFHFFCWWVLLYTSQLWPSSGFRCFCLNKGAKICATQSSCVAKEPDCSYEGLEWMASRFLVLNLGYDVGSSQFEHGSSAIDLEMVK